MTKPKGETIHDKKCIKYLMTMLRRGGYIAGPYHLMDADLLPGKNQMRIDHVYYAYPKNKEANEKRVELDHLNYLNDNGYLDIVEPKELPQNEMGIFGPNLYIWKDTKDLFLKELYILSLIQGK